MSIVDKLASTSGRNDEALNIELAETIAKANDRAAVKKLVSALAHKKKDIQSDSIKVLYEIAERRPELVAAYYNDFLQLLQSKDNRLVWGAMAALDAITPAIPTEIYNNLTTLLEGAANGSVIAKDHAVNILVKLAGIKAYAPDSQALLLDMLKNALPNQLPMYAENALPVLGNTNKEAFVKLITDRLDDMEKESKRKRLEKVLKKLQK